MNLSQGEPVEQTVTEAVGADRESKESGAYLGAIFDAVRDGILVVDLKTRKFTYANVAIRGMLGYAEKELLGLTPADIHPPDLAAFVDARFAALVAREIQVVEGIPTLCKDGSTFTSDISASFMTSGGREYMIGIFRDVTAQHRAAAVLRDKDARLRRAESMVRLGHYAFDGDGGNFVCSDGFKKIWGYDPDADITDRLTRIHPEDFGRVMEEWAKSVEERRGFTLEYRIVYPDSSQVTVRSKAEVEISQPGGSPRWFATVMDVTEPKRAEAALRESEQRYRRLHESIVDAFAEVDMTGRFVDSNSAFRDLLGYTAAELSQLTYLDVTPEHWRESEARIVTEQVLPRGSSEVNEKEYRRKDGSVFPVELRRFLLKDASGKPTGVWAIVRDITQRKMAAEAIAAERDLLRQVLDAQFGFVGVLGLDSVIVEVSQTPLMLMGMQRADVLGKRFCDIGWLAPGAQPQVEEAIRRAALGEVVRFDLVARFPATGPRDVDAVFRPLKNTRGEVTGVIAFGVDITDRKLAEQAMRESEARLSEAQIIARTGSWDLDLVQYRLVWSDEIFRIFEIDKETFEVSYNNFLALIHAEDRNRVDTVWKRSRESGDPYEVHFRAPMPDGRVKHLLARGVFDLGADRRPIRAAGTVQDVTEKKVIEERLERQLREKEILLREIHHRVKNNLEIVSSLLHLQSTASTDPQVIKLFDDSRRRVRAMASVHDILYQSPDMESVPMDAYVEKLATALRATHGTPGRDVRIVTRISVSHVNLQTAIAVGLIVNELVTNALKYAFEGRERGMVVVELRETSPGQLRLAVIDDGRGIPEDMSHNGGGFGLRLTRLLAEQIGGSLEISRGPGAEVAVSFPAPA